MPPAIRYHDEEQVKLPSWDKDTLFMGISKGRLIASAAVIAVSSFAAGLLSANIADDIKDYNHQSEIHMGQTDLINPLLACRPPEDVQFYPQDRIESRIRALIEELKTRHQLQEMSLIFRDLNNGPSFAINPHAKYSGASLLKVPIMVGYLRIAEDRPDILLEKITYDPAKHDSHTHVQLVQPPPPLLPGQQYTVDELMARMITESDNAATIMLGLHRPEADVIPTLQAMGVTLSFVGDDAYISVRDYASLFRILFNSTFLSRKWSNASLRLLSQSRFRAGLVAGVPPDVLVAHKFGERSVDATVQQFHDCGIIYKPKQPYLLCVMSRGSDLPNLIKAVAEVSGAVYQEISSAKP